MVAYEALDRVLERAKESFEDEKRRLEDNDGIPRNIYDAFGGNA